MYTRNQHSSTPTIKIRNMMSRKMTTPALSQQPPPRLPLLCARLGRFAPTALHSRPLALLLNRLLSAPLAEGELDFLEGRVVAVTVDDLAIHIRLTLENGLLRHPRHFNRPDVTIEGGLYEFLLLINRQEDPDTLFFNRRLRLGGDTELGLGLKNFLDALEPEPAWEPLLRLAGIASSTMDRFLPRRAG